MTIVQRLHYKHTNMQIFGEIQTSAGDRKRSDLPALIWQRLVMNPECLTTLHQPLSVKRHQRRFRQCITRAVTVRQKAKAHEGTSSLLPCR